MIQKKKTATKNKKKVAPKTRPEPEKAENQANHTLPEKTEDPKFAIAEEKDNKKKKVKEKATSGFARAGDKLDNERLKELNRSTTFILSCLPPEVEKEFNVACYDNMIDDIGIYMLGLLNRLYKMADFQNPDVDETWEKKAVGYNTEVECQYCGKKIDDPRHMNQVYCNNVCARDAKRKAPGVIKPTEKPRTTEEQSDQKAWEDEQIAQGA